MKDSGLHCSLPEPKKVPKSFTLESYADALQNSIFNVQKLKALKYSVVFFAQESLVTCDLREL